MPNAYLKTASQQLAQREVIEFLISMTNSSPMADETDIWAEQYGQGKFDAVHLDEALTDIRNLLQALLVYA